MLLLTNLASDDKRLGVTISKVYLMRWRIEEYYKFKKQGFGYEKFLVRSLQSIRNLDLLLSVAIGYISYHFSTGAVEKMGKLKSKNAFLLSIFCPLSDRKLIA
jgi:hypothetical protein